MPAGRMLVDEARAAGAPISRERSNGGHMLGRSLTMERAIVGFETDEDGDWVALLRCGHRQHVRHKPPFRVVLGRSPHWAVGTPLNCVLCDEEEENLAADARTEEAGGSPACLANEVCDECGGLDNHRLGCPRQLPPRRV